MTIFVMNYVVDIFIMFSNYTVLQVTIIMSVKQYNNIILIYYSSYIYIYIIVPI